MMVSTASSSTRGPTLPSSLSSPALLTATRVSSTPFRFPSLLVPPSSISFAAPASLSPAFVVPTAFDVASLLTASQPRPMLSSVSSPSIRPSSLPAVPPSLPVTSAVQPSNSQLFWPASNPWQSSAIAPSGTNNVFPSRPYSFSQSQPSGLIAFPGSGPSATAPLPAFVVGSGFPPVTAKTVSSIVNGEFIELGLLLEDSSSVDPPLFSLMGDRLVTVSVPPVKRKILRTSSPGPRRLPFLLWY